MGKSPVDDNKLVLTVNRQPIGEWFKEQWEKLRQGLRQSAEELRKKQRIQVIIPFYIYKNQLNSRILYSDRDNSFQDIKEKKKRYVYFKFWTVSSNRLMNKHLTEYLKSNGND